MTGEGFLESLGSAQRGIDSMLVKKNDFFAVGGISGKMGVGTISRYLFVAWTCFRAEQYQGTATSIIRDVTRRSVDEVRPSWQG